MGYCGRTHLQVSRAIYRLSIKFYQNSKQCSAISYLTTRRSTEVTIYTSIQMTQNDLQVTDNCVFEISYYSLWRVDILRKRKYYSKYNIARVLHPKTLFIKQQFCNIVVRVNNRLIIIIIASPLIYTHLFNYTNLN